MIYFESIFLINPFRDINIVHIFYNLMAQTNNNTTLISNLQRGRRYSRRKRGIDLIDFLIGERTCGAYSPQLGVIGEMSRPRPPQGKERTARQAGAACTSASASASSHHLRVATCAHSTPPHLATCAFWRNTRRRQVIRALHSNNYCSHHIVLYYLIKHFAYQLHFPFSSFDDQLKFSNNNKQIKFALLFSFLSTLPSLLDFITGSPSPTAHIRFQTLHPFISHPRCLLVSAAPRSSHSRHGYHSSLPRPICSAPHSRSGKGFC